MDYITIFKRPATAPVHVSMRWRGATPNGKIYYALSNPDNPDNWHVLEHSITLQPYENTIFLKGAIPTTDLHDLQITIDYPHYIRGCTSALSDCKDDLPLPALSHIFN